MTSYLTLCLMLIFSVQSPVLIIEVSGINEVEGTVMVAVYDNQESFLGKEVVTGSEITVTGKRVTGRLELPFGKYAISVFQDVNSDGELNTNLLGIPNEPYGFSNNVKGNFGPPKFIKVQFEFSENLQRIKIDLY
ncbi:MAG: hypothetical protein DHS20C17_26790 [Cyclobacteriaceae bacterium]|nr:MAG: hypothetical protein DHS20C17_26790 [Cyclobacteriaceae bacterium]